MVVLKGKKRRMENLIRQDSNLYNFIQKLFFIFK